MKFSKEKLPRKKTIANTMATTTGKMTTSMHVSPTESSTTVTSHKSSTQNNDKAGVFPRVFVPLVIIAGCFATIFVWKRYIKKVLQNKSTLHNFTTVDKLFGFYCFCVLTNFFLLYMLKQ